MRTSAPPLLPLLRSAAQGEVIAVIMLNPDCERTVSEIAETAGVSVATAAREIDRLVAAGFVTKRSRGQMRLVQANQQNPATPHLMNLIEVTYGPIPRITRALEELSHVEQAVIYGSYSARRLGHPGSSPVDIDVLVIGRPARREMCAIAGELSRKLGREVNIHAVTPEAWAEAKDSFVKTVRSRPLIEVEVNRG